MGVNTLWDILEKCGTTTFPVSSLRGQTLAVDLSAWVMEFKCSAPAADFHNFYIRSLFYRTIKLLRQGLNLVFVLDGRAPDVKNAALLSRQTVSGSARSSLVNHNRPLLTALSTKCKELLELLGVPCIQSPGEAECMCAYLDKSGLVDGCLCEDNDFFCYGGKTMYRKLRLDGKDYVVNKVTMEDIETGVALTQDDLVALALILGSDYDEKGVPSVGKEKVMTLIRCLKSKGLDILQRIKGWSGNLELDGLEAEIMKTVKKETHCSRCKHLGRISVHEKIGCSICETQSSCSESCDRKCTCDWDKQQQLQSEHKLEINIRRKALNCEGFPNDKIVKEYLEGSSGCSGRVLSNQLSPSDMDVTGLVSYMRSNFKAWDRQKVLDAVVPVIIASQLHRQVGRSQLLFLPVRISGHCKDNHIECYQVEWDKTDKNMWAGESHATSVKMKLDKSMLAVHYPDLVKQYEDSLLSKKYSKGKKRKLAADETQQKITAFIVKKNLDFSLPSDSCRDSNRKAACSSNSSAAIVEEEEKLLTTVKKGKKSCDTRSNCPKASIKTKAKSVVQNETFAFRISNHNRTDVHAITDEPLVIEVDSDG